MNNGEAIRLCLECRTSDASFPLKTGCASCAQMISQEEYNFWNFAPSYAEENANKNVVQSSIQMFKAFFDLITLS